MYIAEHDTISSIYACKSRIFYWLLRIFSWSESEQAIWTEEFLTQSGTKLQHLSYNFHCTLSFCLSISFSYQMPIRLPHLEWPARVCVCLTTHLIHLHVSASKRSGVSGGLGKNRKLWNWRSFAYALSQPIYGNRHLHSHYSLLHWAKLRFVECNLRAEFDYSANII